MYESAKRNYSLKRTRCSVTISDVVLEEFTTYCEENDYVRQKLLELILEEFLDKWGMELPQSGVSEKLLSSRSSLPPEDSTPDKHICN